jgi:hypothetical protein
MIGVTGEASAEASLCLQEKDAGSQLPLAAAREFAVQPDVSVEEFVFAPFEVPGVFHPETRRETPDAGPRRLLQMFEQAGAGLPRAPDEDDVLARIANLVNARLIAFHFDQVNGKTPPLACDRQGSGPFRLDSLCRMPILGREPDQVHPGAEIPLARWLRIGLRACPRPD